MGTADALSALSIFDCLSPFSEHLQVEARFLELRFYASRCTYAGANKCRKEKSVKDVWPFVKCSFSSALLALYIGSMVVCPLSALRLFSRPLFRESLCGFYIAVDRLHLLAFCGCWGAQLLLSLIATIVDGISLAFHYRVVQSACASTWALRAASAPFGSRRRGNWFTGALPNASVDGII